MQAPAAALLALLGELHLEAGDAAGALPYALSATLHCQQLHLARLAPAAALLVARLWHALAPCCGGSSGGGGGSSGGAAQALALLGGALPLALAQRDAATVGRIQAAAAEMMLSDIDSVEVRGGGAAEAKAPGGGNRRRRQRRRVRDAAARLAAGARALEGAGAWGPARDAWRLMAVLMHARGAEEARDAAATRACACERGPLYSSDGNGFDP
jgi:hypothetical protein